MSASDPSSSAMANPQDKTASARVSRPEDAEEKLNWGLDVISKGEPALIDAQLEKYTEGKSSYSFNFQRHLMHTELAATARAR
jgi:hypothetical protein